MLAWKQAFCQSRPGGLRESQVKLNKKRLAKLHSESDSDGERNPVFEDRDKYVYIAPRGFAQEDVIQITQRLGEFQPV